MGKSDDSSLSQGYTTATMHKKRCSWVTDDELYIRYHDREYSVLTKKNDQELFEMLILEIMMAGLSWLTVLKKRENFRQAFDGFGIDTVAAYTQDKVETLMQDAGIIRNRAKLESVIKNAQAVVKIQNEQGNFGDYISNMTKGQVLHMVDTQCEPMIQALTKDMKKRGFVRVGQTTCQSWLHAVGVIHAHEKQCFCYDNNITK